MEDVIIIGAGPAGISAALYTAWSNLNPIVINNGIGALAKAEKIENYYGLEEPIFPSSLRIPGAVMSFYQIQVTISMLPYYFPCGQ